jgi:hypothetical protein
VLPPVRRAAARARLAGTRLTGTRLATLALLACGDAPPLAPARLTGPPASPASAPLAPTPALLDVLADAESRLAPALDPALRASLAPALAELRAAVIAGQARRSDAALRPVRALLAGHAPAHGDGDAADAAALGVVVDLVAAAIRPRAEDAP